MSSVRFRWWGQRALALEWLAMTGLSRDGGLLTPESIPQIGEDFLRELAGLSYE